MHSPTEFDGKPGLSVTDVIVLLAGGFAAAGVMTAFVLLAYAIW